MGPGADRRGGRRLEPERCDRLGRYHLEAAIAAAHATAPDFVSTDWRFIAEQCDGAVAISRAEGAAAGLDALAGIEDHPAPARYYLLPATQARLWLELGDA